ncbi:MAG: bifunctional tetrahydrofolate synthase/dihydrofolate synthase, partial [Gammaproteobacteria bacterium]
QLCHKTCPVISISGSNGKGSCVALIEACALQMDYKVGTYTSPHLLIYNERIKIAGKNVSDETLIKAFDQIEQVREQILLTYFEFGTLAALLIFKQANLDLMILEVGLGGRLDGVNIIDADIAVISTIDIDHSAWLGNDRESIAQEKAGILRANQMAICGDPNPPESLQLIVQQLNVRMATQGQDFSYERQPSSWTFHYDNQRIEDLPLPSLALQNSATALRALISLQTLLPIDLSAIRKGLQSVCLAGRLQTIPGDITHVLDVAHNAQSIEHLATHLKQFSKKRQILAVFSMLADKDIASAIRPLIHLIKTWFVAPVDNERSAPSKELINSLESYGIQHHQSAKNVLSAYQQALSQAQTGDIIVIFGSFYTVSPVLQFLIR